MAEANHMNYVPKEIAALCFFYPDITNSQQATTFIKNYSPVSAGCYLLRQSSKGENYLSLSVSISDSSVRHINVVMEKQGGYFLYYIVPELKFTSFMELCSFYKQHRIGNLEKIDNVRLLYPINRNRQYEQLGRSTPQAMITHATSTNSLQSEMSPDTKTAYPVKSRSTSSFRETDRELSFSHISLDSITEVNAVATGLPSPSQKAPDLRTNITEKDRQRKASVPDSRPPLPPPNCATMHDVYYSTPFDENAPKLETLKRNLKNSERCDCGILLIDSALPDGWTIHRSQEAATRNKLFYQDIDGRTTWNFPPQLLLYITEGQRQTIIRLSKENGFAPPSILFSPDRDQVIEELLRERKKSGTYQSAVNIGEQVVPVNKQFLSSGSTVLEATSSSQQWQNTRQNVDIKDRFNDDSRERLSANMNGRQTADIYQRQNVHVRDMSNVDITAQPNGNINANTRQVAQGEQQYLTGKSYMYVPTGPGTMYRKHSSDPERQPQQV